MQSQSKLSSFLGRTTVIVTLLWLGFFVLLPALGLLTITFFEKSPVRLIEPNFTLDNFRVIFTPTFLKIFFESFRLASGATLLCLLLGYPFAYAISRASKKNRSWLLLLVIIPFWTNSLIRTYAVIILLRTKGLLNLLLLKLHIVDAPLEILYTDVAIFIGLSYTLLPFMVLPIYANLEDLDRNLIDTAQDLGASPLQAFCTVTLPLTVQGIMAGSIFVFLPALGMFYIPELLGGAKTMQLGTYIKNQFLITRNWPMGAVASLSMTLALLVLVVVYLKLTKKREGK